MFDIIKNARARGVPELDESLDILSERASEVAEMLSAGHGASHLRQALIRFVLAAREHLRREQAVYGGEASVPQWWRYFYLARVLDDMQKATLADPLNRLQVERLLEQWASEQFAVVAATDDDPAV